MQRWSYFAGILMLGAVVAAAQDSSSPRTASNPPAANAAKKPAKNTAPQSNSQDAVPDAPLPSADAVAPRSGVTPPPVDASPSGDAGSAGASRPAPLEAPPAAAAGKKKSAAEDNPFPEEDSKAAAKADAQGAAADQPGTVDRPGAAPGSAGQDGGAASSSQQGLDKLDLYGEKDKKSRRNADPDAGLAYDPKLAAQDDKIGDFYLKNGNAPGAYARYKDATQHDAGDADAVFGMAEAARQMNMTGDAVAGFQTYLFAFPDGPRARAAKKALAELKVKSTP